MPIERDKEGRALDPVMVEENARMQKKLSEVAQNAPIKINFEERLQKLGEEIREQLKESIELDERYKKELSALSTEIANAINELDIRLGSIENSIERLKKERR